MNNNIELIRTEEYSDETPEVTGLIVNNKPKFKECIEKYSLQYSDRIRGIVLIELKKGYKLPVSLMPSQKADKSINVEP